MNITVVGLGYVGTANAVLFAQQHTVIALDISAAKVSAINAKQSPIADTLLDTFLNEKTLNLHATLNKEEAYRHADIIIIATPTNFNPDTNHFDTHSVQKTIAESLAFNKTATLIIKSTVPVGFTEAMRARFSVPHIIFSPEFLREGYALQDNLFPTRIIVGDTSARGQQFATLCVQAAHHDTMPTLLTNSNEAEAIKLFSNTYLAMRVAYFNEIDTYAIQHGLNAQHLIEGVSLDPRIGMHYNNPSFGYGGYCLPKDTKQLLSNYADIPQNLIQAIVDANETRKQFIAADILKKSPACVGIYRLVMKAGSDNFRSSSIQDIIQYLKAQGTSLIIFEPHWQEAYFMDIPVINDFERFTQQASIIVANRKSAELVDVLDKVYTRDLFGGDT